MTPKLIVVRPGRLSSYGYLYVFSDARKRVLAPLNVSSPDSAYQN